MEQKTISLIHEVTSVEINRIKMRTAKRALVQFLASVNIQYAAAFSTRVAS